MDVRSYRGISFRHRLPADSRMAENMSSVARAGHPCGADFHAEDFLKEHPEYSWQKPLLRDMKAGPWTKFRSGQTENGSSTAHAPNGASSKQDGRQTK